MHELKLDQITGGGTIQYLSGKKKGLEARKALDVDRFDTLEGPIKVIVPNGLDCNESFIAGVFSNSISKLSSRADFLHHYQFENMSERFSVALNNVISATLAEGTTALSGLRKK